MSKSFKFALITTIPVMLGYLFMGAAFGLLLEQAGYNYVWAFFISLFMYAGSGQFLLTGLLTSGASLFQTAAMQLSINCRHFFYGLSFLKKFRCMGKKYYYMIFSLTDETYSLLCSVKLPPDTDEKKVFFSIAALNQSYWIIGCVVGSLLGEFIPFSTQGIDFAMTALFVVILTEQWQSPSLRLPAAIGGASAAFCLLIFGKDTFILPSLLLSVALLLIFRKRIEALHNKAVDTNA